MPDDDHDYLARVLCDADAFHEHLNDLLFSWQVLGPARFWRRLSAARCDACLEGGPGVLSGAEAALLLGDPFVLTDLADRIHDEMPEAWLDHLVAAGARLRVRYGLDV